MAAAPSIEQQTKRKASPKKVLMQIARAASSTERSGVLTATADSANAVSVDVSFRPGSLDIASLRDAISGSSRAKGRGTKTSGTIANKVIREALAKAVASVFRKEFSAEIDKVVEAYREMLHESIAKQDDPALKSALNRARLQEKILASASMVDQGQACELLGLSTANPSATMTRKEGKEVLRFTIDGRAAYPLFQFDVDGRRVVPAMSRLLAVKPEQWSNFRLLHWLTRQHLDFDDTPAEALATKGEDVIAAFKREIELPVHG